MAGDLELSMAACPMIEVVPNSLRLNLGCSDAHVKGWLNVDRCEPADVITDLSQSDAPK